MTTLRQKMKQEMTLRGFSAGTQKHYLYAVTQLNDYYHRSPAKLSEEEVKSFLLFLISNRKLAASTYNVMIHGLKFFYEVVLNKKMLSLTLPRRKEPQKLPDILSQEEIERIIKVTANIAYRTMFILIYGAGLRASEVVKLRVKDIDSQRGMIHIRESKGNKDRYVILSKVMLSYLRQYWQRCRVKKK
jgi:integrase/recombinase XerD